MSSPIAIPRAMSSTSSSQSSSLASSPATSLTSGGLYVPVHKRTSSRGSSRAHSPAAAARSPSEPVKQTHVYSANFLLSLRPNADESMKEKMRASCPEVVMNRRMRKSHEFHEHQVAKAQRQHAHGHEHHHPQQHPEPKNIERHHVVVSAPLSPSPVVQQRISSRRNQPAGRPAERRRNALQSLSSPTPSAVESWRGMRITALPPLAVV